MVVPISEPSYEYAKEVRAAIRKVGIHVDADCSNNKMQKKVSGGIAAVVEVRARFASVRREAGGGAARWEGVWAGLGQR